MVLCKDLCPRRKKPIHVLADRDKNRLRSMGMHRREGLKLILWNANG
jgi:hypothetical protein